MKQCLFICLAASFAISAQCQTKYPNLMDPDVIYFESNRPEPGKINRQMNTVVNSQAQFNRPDGSQQPNGQNVLPTNAQNALNFAPTGVNRPHALQHQTINTQTIQQKLENNYNTVQQPVYDPNVVNRQSAEDNDDIQVVRNKNQIRFDYTATALSNFSLNVMKTVTNQKKGNIVLSPYSIASLLSLLQQGATEQALDQISVALQMTPQASAAAYRAQTQDIQSRNSRNILRTANNVFIADAFVLNPLFRIVAQRDFDSDVTPTIFQRSDQAAQLINQWVASKTNNIIDKLITPESVSVNTQMVMVNAIYFKGLWEMPFRAQATKPDAFRYRDGTVKNVPFMAIKRHFRGIHDKYSDSKVVVLPFEREEYSLMILLPSELSNADDLIRSLTVSQLESYLNLRTIEVALRLPKFTVRADTDLTPVLKQMGVTRIFNQNSGLSGLGSFRDFVPQVSSAVHSAVLTIDEEGGSAAAASAFAVVALSNDGPYMFMKVDRPFVVVLWDGKTKLPLFMAKIEDPSL